MPRPKGSIGATKMKIMAVICRNCNENEDCYGYGIWRCLKENFHVYINDSDIRNVYHHLEDLYSLGYIEKIEGGEDDSRTLYRITREGRTIKEQYEPYLKILKGKLNPVNSLGIGGHY